VTARDPLAGSALFAGVPARTRSALLERAATRQLAPGTRSLSAGQLPHSLLVILEGTVDVCLAGHDGPLVRLNAGECVGELSLIDGQPASADVVAASATTVLELSHDDVWALINRSGVFARNLLRVLAGRVRNDDLALTMASDRRRHYERLSMADGLTGLHNRRWFDAVFPPHLDRLRAENRHVALLMADVDWFKELNDVEGHQEGDALLRRIAVALTDGLRPDDLLARYGGEEFAALVADLDGVAALEVADRLRAAVGSLERAGARPCTISIGVAVAMPGEPFDGLVHRADAALFRAKEGGRNRVSD